MAKISFCTVCMNRLFHIRETLPQNIESALQNPNVEFVLLDYNSTDGLENWVRTQMAPYIENGILKYAKTNEPKYFDRSHSRNLAINIASGSIIALVDADNYLGDGYIDWIEEVFDKHGSSAIITTIAEEGFLYSDQGGKCAFYKEKFHQARGFDEMMFGYGFEDVDLINRLALQGGKRIIIDNSNYLKFISHSYFERISNEYLIRNISNVYTLQPSGIDKTVLVIYLMVDGSFIQITFTHDPSIVNDVLLSYWGYQVQEELILRGVYFWEEDNLSLNYNSGQKLYYKHSNVRRELVDPILNLVWTRLEENTNQYIDGMMIFSECWNRFRFKVNQKQPYLVNTDTWGKGKAFLNFSDQLTIISSDDVKSI